MKKDLLNGQKYKPIKLNKPSISKLKFFNFKYICQSARINFIQEILTQVTVGENEGIESALRRFKRQVSKSGIFADLKRLRHHETPIEKYKRKLQQRRKAKRR